MFDNLSAKVGSFLGNLRKQGKINSSALDSLLAQLRESLLDSDVALPVVDSFMESVSRKVNEQLDSINKSINPANGVFAILQAEIINLLSQERTDAEGNSVSGQSGHAIRFAKKPPTIIMLVGLQGAGKTTLAGKLALKLKNESNTPLLVAADLQRPSAVEQLKVIGDSVKVPVFAPEPGSGVGDPVKVARQSIEFAREKLHNVVIIDTAGRLGVDQELLAQARQIKDAVNPDEVFFVVDAMIGQDAVVTAKAFGDAVGFDAVILTKLDGDARGGAALSITSTVKKPIIFASIGEKMEDFDYFYPDRIASRILGMGDIATLSEKAKQVIDEDKAKALESKITSGEGFSLEDFLEQIEAISKMGNFAQILGSLPGANSGAMKKQIDALDGSELVRMKAIIQSMTPAERATPNILNGSRRARIAAGSGRQVSEINRLVDRFSAMQKMMKQMGALGGKSLNGESLKGKKGGFGQKLGLAKAALSGFTPGMGAGLGGEGGSSFGGALPAGLGSLAGGAAVAKGGSVGPNKKKSRSGNPAKRAAEEGR